MIKKLLLFFIVSISMPSFAGKTIYIVPFQGAENDMIFADPYNKKSDGTNAFCALLRKFIDRGYKVKTTTTLKN